MDDDKRVSGFVREAVEGIKVDIFLTPAEIDELANGGSVEWENPDWEPREGAEGGDLGVIRVTLHRGGE